MLYPDRLAFDTSAYRDTSVEAVAHDLKALTIENSHDAPVERRIHSGRLMVSSDGGVIDAYTKLKPRYSRKDEFDTREANSGDKFDHVLLTHPEGTIVIWISPNEGPKMYEESRMRVGFRETWLGQTTLLYCGIPIKGEKAYQEFLQIGAKLSEFALGNFDLSDPEKLRDQVFIIPRENIEEPSPWEFLEKQIPNLRQAWEAISSGLVDVYNEEVLQDSLLVAPLVHSQVQRAKSNHDFLLAGVIGEQHMMQQGYHISGSGCGRLNSEILDNLNPTMLLWKQEISINGQTVTKFNISVEKCKTKVINGVVHYLVEKCGQCPLEIHDYIPAGWKCPGCGGVYEGCA